jgi:VIT1/CCC1 family predicted Fe2+/Mn2+ transporter
MKKISHKKFHSRKNKYLFGSASAIITNLALIAGLYLSQNAKVNIIGGILVIALADNIADTLGIHIYQEAEGLASKEVWISSLTNFASRFFLSIIFILLFMVFSIETAALLSIILGLLLISGISYFIAIHKKKNPYVAVAEHIGVAFFVIILSRILGNMVIDRFSN